MSLIYVYKHSLIINRHTVFVHLSHLFPLGDYPSDINRRGFPLLLIHQQLYGAVDLG
jgi:hypothetical protein